MKLNTQGNLINRLQAKVEEMGGRLIGEQVWQPGGDEKERRTLRLGERGVRLQEGWRNGISIEVKTRLDNPDPWQYLVNFLRPEVELMTLEQTIDWIVAHPFPGDDEYIASVVRDLETFIGRS